MCLLACVHAHVRAHTHFSMCAIVIASACVYLNARAHTHPPTHPHTHSLTHAVHVRESAESIAFYNGQQRERQEAAARFSASVDNKAGLLNFERNLNFFTRWYKYLVQIVPAVVIGPQYFAGKVPLGAISQSFFSFNHVLTDLSIVVNEFTGPNGISSFSAQVSHLDLQSVYACM